MTARGTRLQKVIAQAGVASRRHAEQMILAGSVRVNGRVVQELGTCVVPGKDRLEVEGRPLRWPEGPPREVWALYKPKRCVTTLDDPEGRSTVKEFFPRTRARLIPVGRLDYDAEGLILLTNDGDLANRVAHPSHDVPKTYFVKVKGLVTREHLQALRGGPRIGGRAHRSARARVLHTVGDKTWLEVTLKEGIHHHIKRMFAALGYRVLKIKRYQIGPVALEELAPGECRRLTDEEIAALLGERPRRQAAKAGTRA
jgi:pseudouridine synthase